MITAQSTCADTEKQAPTSDVFCQTDWEKVFEEPESGIIAMIENARTVRAYHKSVVLIVQALLVRDDDGPLRAELEARLDSFVGENDNAVDGIDVVKEKAIAALREIKDHRQKKSDECWLLHRQDEDRRIAETKDAEAAVLKAVAARQPVAEEPAPVETENKSVDDIQEVFAAVLWDFIERRLKAIRADDEIEKAGTPAFIVSGVFADHFGAIVREHIAPHMLDGSKAFVKKITEQPVDDRRRFLADHFESRNGRADMWDRWQKSWTATTLPQALPTRPKEKKSTGLMGMLKPKKKKPGWKKEMTVEEWEKAVKKIKVENKKATQVWDDICTEDDAYQSPVFEDNKLLMDLFARGEKALLERTSGLRQIVDQGGGSVARNLVKFMGTKDMDLPLLAISCRKPELFLGPDGALRDLFKGFADGEAEEKFPLTMRFLSDRI